MNIAKWLKGVLKEVKFHLTLFLTINKFHTFMLFILVQENRDKTSLNSLISFSHSGVPLLRNGIFY